MRIGDTRASFKAEGNTPVVIDKFTMSAMNGAKMDTLSFTRPVGMGSSLHDLHADFTTKSVISFVVTFSNVDRCEVVLASLKHSEGCVA